VGTGEWRSARVDIQSPPEVFVEGKEGYALGLETKSRLI